MTREEAITELNTFKIGAKSELGENALDMAIKALEQEPCGKDINVSTTDAISREAVDTLVDELARAISDERCGIPRGRSTATIMQDILDLPPVNPQPKTGHWIPVSERLPDEKVEVLATTVWGSITIAERYSSNKYFIYDGAKNADEDEIIAWMPLPEPYRAESEEKKHKNE